MELINNYTWKALRLCSKFRKVCIFDFNLPPRSKGDLRSYITLHSLWW